MVFGVVRAAIAASVVLLGSVVVQTVTAAPAYAQDCQRDARTQNRNRTIGNIASNLLGQRARQAGLDYSTSNMVGDLVGGEIAGFLDACDREKASGATRQALDGQGGGRRVAWTSDNNEGTGGSAEVTRQRQRPDGGRCRTVTEIAYREGQEVREEVEYCQPEGGGEWARV